MFRYKQNLEESKENYAVGHLGKSLIRKTLSRILSVANILLLLALQQDAENNRPDWHLIFHDEFSGEQLDTTKWDTAPRWGRADPKGNELQYYAEDAFEFSDGILRIKAEQRSMGGKEYTSGLIESSFKFAQAYGKFEIRAKVPKGKGLWSAFWLVPERTWPPEIDVFEYLGHQPQTMYLSQHWANAAGQHESNTEAYAGGDFSQDFHIYAVEWSSTEIIWYIDGVERLRSTKHIPHEPMFITANLVVGGQWPGDPDRSTPFPSYLEIDYIRVYTFNSYRLPVILSRSEGALGRQE